MWYSVVIVVFYFFPVPCYKRVKEMEYTEPEVNVDMGDGGDDWVATHNDSGFVVFFSFSSPFFLSS